MDLTHKHEVQDHIKRFLFHWLIEKEVGKGAHMPNFSPSTCANTPIPLLSAEREESM